MDRYSLQVLFGLAFWAAVLVFEYDEWTFWALLGVAALCAATEITSRYLGQALYGSATEWDECVDSTLFGLILFVVFSIFLYGIGDGPTNAKVAAFYAGAIATCGALIAAYLYAKREYKVSLAT